MARDSIRCSFCGKKQEQVGRIIAGPNVYICNECVELCSSILHDEMHNGLNEQQLELPDTLPHAAADQDLHGPLYHRSGRRKNRPVRGGL